MYVQIVTILVILMLIYYGVMIALDIQTQKANSAANADINSEQDIDISDEAESFRPTLVSREGIVYLSEENDLASINESSVDINPEATDLHDSLDNNTSEKLSFRRPGYREPLMTGGITVEDLIEEIDNMAENKASDLGEIIHVWKKPE